MWNKTSWVSTPMKAYNDYQDLSEMQKVDLDCSIQFNQNATTNAMTLTNTSSVIAFFANAKLLDADGNIITSVYWDDNYISIPPNESIELNA